ncbi:MAG TPA: hypothetical protein VJA00_02915, partial [Candidatus Omnitrophota bacterium]|nr:hypothetical protein [Candidatus Omnitrophota bacterium]
HNEDGSTKRKAILILTILGTQGAVDILLNGLGSARDQSLRFELIRALNRIREKGECREFSKWIVKKEILTEAANYGSTLKVVGEYQKRVPAVLPENDYLLATLQAIREESLERLFRLLALLYDPEMIHVIYDRLIETASDKRVKANALELLENILEADLSRALSPLLEHSNLGEINTKTLDELILEFLESGDRWLSVCAIFMIVELHLSHFYYRLNGALQSRIPVVHEAAEIALIKTAQTGP